LESRELYEILAGEVVHTYPVAVGREGFETPTGRFHIYKVDWNPDWFPPPTEWAEDEEYRAPGHPTNPMGRVQLWFARPYSLHGTEALHSLGEAASHGSVRVANHDIINIGRRVMNHGGVHRTDDWYRDVLDTPTELRRIVLPKPIPLKIRD
jgi:lipoprotein-anchoring transpeptidase ErfK/SrfK